MNLARYNKLWVAASGLVAQLVADGLIDGDAARIATAVIAAVTAAGVFAVPNDTSHIYAQGVELGHRQLTRDMRLKGISLDPDDEYPFISPNEIPLLVEDGDDPAG